jgi:hypothetical protein
MAKYNLYQILNIIFEENENLDQTEEVDQDKKDNQTIQEFIKTYSILKNIKEFTISFGYSDLGLNEEQDLESISSEDIKSIPDIETEKETLQINNQNVLKILNFIKRKITVKMIKKPKDQNNRTMILPFIIKMSWTYAGVKYNLNSNYFNKKLTVTDYNVNNSTHQVDKINRFISRRSVIKNSPFRLLGSILVYNDWAYDWSIKDMEQDLPNRKI